MKCPKCDSEDLQTKESRPHQLGEVYYTRRRRSCVRCSGRFTTYEVSAEDFNKIKLFEKTHTLVKGFYKSYGLLKQRAK